MTSAFDLLPLNGIRARIAGVAAGLRAAGIVVEDKLCSIALYYRSARNRSLAVAQIECLLETLDTSLGFFGGRCAFNIVLAGTPAKGNAVLALMPRARTAVRRHL